jgi:hypothetical protein
MCHGRSTYYLDFVAMMFRENILRALAKREVRSARRHSMYVLGLDYRYEPVHTVPYGLAAAVGRPNRRRKITGDDAALPFDLPLLGETSVKRQYSPSETDIRDWRISED